MKNKLKIEFEITLKTWCLPLAIEFDKNILHIGILCFHIEFENIKRK